MPNHVGTRFPLMTQGDFSPSDVGGGKIWCRYDKGITIATGVSQWDDQFSEGNHLKQATGLDQPSQESDGSVLCDGIRQFMKADAFTWVQPETIYLLCRLVTWTNLDRLFDGNVGDSTIIWQNGTTPGLKSYSGTSSAEDNGLAVGVYGVLTAVFNGAAGVFQINNNTANTGDYGTNDSDGFALGARANGANFANIQVKELVGYSNAHDAVTRARMIQYLSGIGGI